MTATALSARVVRAACGAAVAFGALAVLAAPHALGGEKQTSAKQTALSTAGTVAWGSLGGGTFGPGRPPHFDVVLAAPAGVVAGTGPLDAGDPADLRRTWVTFDEVDGTTGRDV